MIDDDVLRGRHPRLGTITTGYGVEATSQRGSTYAQPKKADTLVFHTDDRQVAEAVCSKLGGRITDESPNWSFDVVTDSRSAEVMLLPRGFRQALEHWRAAECVRRCDGRVMETLQGRPTRQPCMCEGEIASGQERLCSPSTTLPVIVELDVERFGVWEVKSNAWGTAGALKGTIGALRLVGSDAALVPAVLAMVDRKMRDQSGKVWDVVDLHATIALSHQQLADRSQQVAVEQGIPAGQLPSGDDGLRIELMQQWSDLQARAHRAGLRSSLQDDWRTMFGESGRRDFAELTVEELAAWVGLVRGTVEDREAEDAAALGTNEDAPQGPEPSGEGQATPDEPAADPDDPWA